MKSILILIAISCRSAFSSYTLGIRDSIMIAHSFDGSEFGPAQGLHGATYTVDVDFVTDDLVPKLNWVIGELLFENPASHLVIQCFNLDIGSASDMLSEILKKYNYKVP